MTPLSFFRIVPQAICTRFGLAIGYYFSPLVWLLLVILFPISFPIALLLDKILGKGHNTFFRRAGEWVHLFPYLLTASVAIELRELVKMHGSDTHDNEEPLSHDEVIMTTLLCDGMQCCGLDFDCQELPGDERQGNDVIWLL